jgi:type I restriction enzyme M protein
LKGSLEQAALTGGLHPGASPPATLLYCPIRGPLNVLALAKDGLTATEEARRIDFLKFLLDREYPEKNIAVETLIIKELGESGRNKLRCDVIVYGSPVNEVRDLPLAERLKRAIIVAEIKRDSKKSASAWAHQLEPAMRLLPGMKVMGAYWDDLNRLLFTKHLVSNELEIFQDTLANLPRYGSAYKRKLLTFQDLSPSHNLVGVLFNIANVMRSHGVNDEHTRYRETVKLLLARYCDERESAGARLKPLALQLYSGDDPDFMPRITGAYATAAKRYSRAKTLFDSRRITDLSERTLRDIIKQIQGIDFLSASNETMQQVFMSFVPAVFKKSLDQYFTPIELVKVMVQMVSIGPNDKIADPGMGTADFLTAAAELRANAGDKDILQRIYGMDSDAKAFDLAVVNMILNKDGQSNLSLEDSIERQDHFATEMDVVLCNPPFGEKSIEGRAAVLKHYDLGHEWRQDNATGEWQKTDRILPYQQLGLLFLERCFKLLADKGRLAIILPEGYLCTPMYGYVRQWILKHLRVLALVELPRRTFVKSNADLRSNILVAQKLSSATLKKAVESDYPIYADMVRKIGFKMGKGFSPLYVRDSETGIEIRDQNNSRVPDTDFRRVSIGFDGFTKNTNWNKSASRQFTQVSWDGARVSDILRHPNLDLKPRRIMPRALQNIRNLKDQKHIVLREIADVVEQTMDVVEIYGPSKNWRPVAGMDIRAVEAIVTPSHPTRAWQIAEQKNRSLYLLKDGDIVVGLVRPERRNIGLLLGSGDDIVGIPDGIAVVRVRSEFKKTYPQEWLLASLRSEPCRLQLWTESGGTSYGKLTLDHIKNLLLPVQDQNIILDTATRVTKWAESIRTSAQKWEAVGNSDDRRPIVNSPGFGLIEAENWDLESADDD